MNASEERMRELAPDMEALRDFVARATCLANPDGTPATVLDVTVLVCGVSRSKARQLITSGGVYVNNVRMTDPDLAWAWIP